MIVLKTPGRTGSFFKQPTRGTRVCTDFTCLFWLALNLSVGVFVLCVVVVLFLCLMTWLNNNS